ncbi:phospholipase D family protein [Hydrogenophaga sp. BPS33]|uniref:phospholipase D family protein n=1 Tax=Hydrogenophaga sp. BPS33 TaxID=2651974 RepID=UPI00131F7560|nr:phospholipase D family protein [Hydrogenophaga sp. BPS33]QHE89067.1 phospholipase D family protein [Hydrogenophaga sp. BPS33]
MAALLSILLQGCALPPLDGRSETQALPPAEAASTPLGQALAAQTQAHAGQSGILPLADALESFAARVLLVRAAQRTLDVQYYIWRDDVTGKLLLEALREAAERGVRVRLLLDDNGVSMDDRLLALDQHPQIDVRLFNPFSIRQPKALGYLTHFSRANRRMHNKALVADNQAAIVGGRNVGDEYFGATDGVLFADLDVLAIGAVVPDLSTDFDRYWASASSYPIDRIVTAPRVAQVPVANAERDPRAARYVEALRRSRFVPEMLSGRLAPEWARVEMVSDDPRKGLGLAEKEGLVTHQLAEVLARPPVQSLDLVSPYFVPTAAGVDVFARLASQGVRVRILTNALEATDVSAVHSGYARYRKDLLRAGVELYEMRRGAVGPEKSGVFGSSGSSLHAKTFGVDGERVFVGSMNFDPRSAHLNTELGFIIDSRVLAEAVGRAFDTEIRAAAYAVRLDEQGDLVWIEYRDGQEIRHTREPGSSLGSRVWLGLLSVLPIEWLL